ncbi:MAG: glycosyltransferase family 39 protein [candidate division KSB1 bacterium]|nr:glycosyltransferase family 39 protein [candidate division KSB1 bacterium]MDZ7275983.1 glycosyltransferase family 39 protein [candidate division KSB1 bacterium]MDZ7285735.1 glycosyltransferase family 39 protein [candidate division KSB1 bacterium]MDZ7298767.1 glycosyltransferase family 39 protein [candidate division KSB1 bacterium]MDZ7305950.1 glycosyltransferase family 39 protein [candidate division KSB1 bacterium]
MNTTQKSRDWPFLGLLAAALLFRLLLLRFRFAIGWDEPHYLNLAANFATANFHGWLHPFWSPLYPALSGLLSLLVPDLEVAGRLVNIICGGLLLWPIYRLGVDLFGRNSARGAAALVAFYPPLAFGATSALAEPVYMLFATLGLWCGWESLKRDSARRALLAGLCWGLAYLTRPEGVGFLLVFVLFVTLLTVGDWFRARRLGVMRLAVVAGSAWLLAALPYIFYLHGETGRWTLSAKGAAVQQLEAQYFAPGKLGTFDTLSEDNRVYPNDQIYHDGDFVQAAARQGGLPIQNSPALLVRKYATHLHRLTRSELPAIFSLGLLVPFVLGLFGSPWQPAQARLSFYLLSCLGFFWFIVVPLFHINERYLIALLPVAIIWAGHGLVLLKDWLVAGLCQSRRGARWSDAGRQRCAWSGVLGFVLFFGFGTQLGSIVQRRALDTDFWSEAVELKQAGKWLRRHTSKTPVLMSYNKAVNFYAGNHNIRSGATFSQNEWPRLVQYAGYRGVTHVVWAERYAAHFPNLQQLNEPATAPPELHAIYDQSPAPGLRTIIYLFEPAVDRSPAARPEESP